MNGLKKFLVAVVVLKSLNEIGGYELQGKGANVALTGGHASSVVWRAPFAFLCTAAVAQLTSHALQAQDHPWFPLYLWPGTPEIHIIGAYFYY